MATGSKLTHLDSEGRARMVDVGDKPHSERTARAEARLLASSETLDLVRTGQAKKGDVITVAEIAGVMGGKKTADLIPLCHPLPLSKINVKITLEEDALRVVTETRTTGQTGVEMEALTAAGIAALTLYDMLKAVDKSMTITGLRLLEKTGGVSGDYKRDE
ncbi:MAG: cyclic pyranopterin monophosphate synthase MoaC [Henriciella sp.]|nr:cyclic pyranopterin monophosphate synthase MoaC [Henriciella sp.]